MKRSCLAIVAAGMLFMAGCGGASGSGTGPRANQGTFAMSVKWPALTRGILDTSESIQVSVIDSEGNDQTRILSRPDTQLTFSNLAPGDAEIQAVAYELTNAGGAVKGVGSATASIVAGQVARTQIVLTSPGGGVVVVISDGGDVNGDDGGDAVDDGGDAVDDGGDTGGTIDDGGDTGSGGDSGGSTGGGTEVVSAKLSLHFLPKKSRYARGTDITYETRLTNKSGIGIAGKKLSVKLIWDGGKSNLGQFTTDSSGYVRLNRQVPTGDKDNVNVVVTENEPLIDAPAVSLRIPIGT